MKRVFISFLIIATATHFSGAHAITSKIIDIEYQFRGNWTKPYRYYVTFAKGSEFNVATGTERFDDDKLYALIQLGTEDGHLELSVLELIRPFSISSNSFEDIDFERLYRSDDSLMFKEVMRTTQKNQDTAETIVFDGVEWRLTAKKDGRFLTP